MLGILKVRVVRRGGEVEMVGFHKAEKSSGAVLG